MAFAVTGAVAAALVVHGFGMKAVGRMDGGADFEDVRTWDAKHPDKSIGQYEGAFKPEKKHASKASDEEGR